MGRVFILVFNNGERKKIKMKQITLSYSLPVIESGRNQKLKLPSKPTYFVLNKNLFFIFISNQNKTRWENLKFTKTKKKNLDLD